MLASRRHWCNDAKRSQFFVRLFWILLSISCYCPFAFAAPVQQPKAAKETSTTTTTMNNPLEPIVITSRNIWDYLPASGNTITILEFYAPSCRHCVDFAPTYSAVAEKYHGQQQPAASKKKQKKIVVAKINGAREQSLVTRFGIVAYPTIFIIDGGSVYEFTDRRTQHGLMQFAEGGYKTAPSVPWLTESGMGPLGLLQGGLVYGGHVVTDAVVEKGHGEYGLSYAFMGWMAFSTMFMGLLVCIVLLALCVPAGKVKVG